MDQIRQDYRAIQKRALEQPGLKDLLKAYGEYEDTLKVALSYLSVVVSRPVVTNSNSSLELGD